MPQVDPQDFYKDFQNLDFKPLYFLMGDEPYLLEQSLTQFKTLMLSEIDYDFNFSSFFAADAEVDKIKDAVETLPMMKDRRLVFVKEAQAFTDKEWEALEPLIKTPVDSTVLVLATTGKIDKRKRIFKTLLDKAQCVEFKKPYDNQVQSWIQHIAKGMSLTVTEEATQLIHRFVGNNLTEIEAQLGKLRDMIAPRTQVQGDDVRSGVSHAKELSVFDFTKAVGFGDQVIALEQLVKLLDQGQSEMGIIALLARHIRVLVMIRRGLDQGLYGAKLAQFALVPNYFVENYIQQAKLWSNKHLSQILVLLSFTDKALKSSPISSHIWLENLVLKICSLKKEEWAQDSAHLRRLSLYADSSSATAKN